MTQCEALRRKGNDMSLAEAWEQATSADDYINQMTQNEDSYRENIDRTTIGDAERQIFGGDPLNFLILTEDFCGDSAQFVPPLVKLAAELESVEIRFLLRDQHRELASRYRRADGYQAIPVIILLDEQLDEIGFLIERPRAVNEQMAAETRRFADAHPELPGGKRNIDRMPEATRTAIKEHIGQWRGQNQEAWTATLFDELAEILQEEPSRQAAG